MDLALLNVALPVVRTILKTLNSTSSMTLDTKNIEEVTDEADKQVVLLQLAQLQARVAQELAIAIRIETADEVEIEEFYDTSKDGKAGITGSSKSVEIGVSGSARKITKRVYKFKGQNDKKAEVYEQKLNEILGSNKTTG